MLYVMEERQPGTLSSVCLATNGLSVPCMSKARDDHHIPSLNELPVLRLCDATQRHPGGLLQGRSEPTTTSQKVGGYLDPQV